MSSLFLFLILMHCVTSVDDYILRVIIRLDVIIHPPDIIIVLAILALLKKKKRNFFEIEFTRHTIHSFIVYNAVFFV